MKKVLFVASCALFLVFQSTSVKSQTTDTKTSSVAVTIATVAELTADNSGLSTFAFTTAAELTTGIQQLNAVNLAYKSNKITKLSINASTANFAGASATPMPSTVIEFRKSGGSYLPLNGTTPIDFSTSQARGAANFNMDYKITPGYNYDPALDYTITLVYTLTAP